MPRKPKIERDPKRVRTFQSQIDVGRHLDEIGAMLGEDANKQSAVINFALRIGLPLVKDKIRKKELAFG